MDRILKRVAAVAVTAAVALAGTGCGPSHEEMRPDKDAIVVGDHGPQCRDLRELAARLAPGLLACNDIVRNPNRITVVVKNMANKTEDMPGRDMTIYVKKLAGLLNTNVTADRMQFVEEQATLRNLQAQELGSADPFGEAGRAPTADPRLLPQYALYGTVYSMNSGRTSYYYFEFKLTNLTTGAEAWHGDYDVRTLNYD